MTITEARPDRHHRRGSTLTVVGAIAVWAVVIGTLTWFIAASHAASRHVLRERTAARVDLGAEWATLYVQDVFARERKEGQAWLSGRDVSTAAFSRTMSGFGVPAAVLLNSRGQLLQVVPPDPALLGGQISHRYAHLASAVAGRQAVSNVVPSAALSDPVVGFATPFQTRYGRRVISGAYDVSRTPLGAYLGHLAVTPGHQVFLVDAKGTVIASSDTVLGAKTLTEVDPRLATAAAGTAISGNFNTRTGAQYFVTAPVVGTPWRLLLSVPQAQLYQSADSGAWLQWLVVAGFGIAGLWVIGLLARLQSGRAALADVNDELDRLAHIDSLTGVMTRRAITHQLEQSLSVAGRHDQAVTALLVDIDHFKQLNDTLGHHAGDLALAHTVHVLAATLRLEDVVGRWGGEEFLVVLPMTDAAGAASVAERIRLAIEQSPPHIGEADWPLTVTIGVATWSGEAPDELVGRADAALYLGKNAGRNIVSLAPELVDA